MWRCLLNKVGDVTNSEHYDSYSPQFLTLINRSHKAKHDGKVAVSSGVQNHILVKIKTMNTNFGLEKMCKFVSNSFLEYR